MHKLILQLKYTLHPVGVAGIDPAYNMDGKAIGQIDCVSEEDGRAKINEFLTKNNLYKLENQNGPRSN